MGKAKQNRKIKVKKTIAKNDERLKNTTKASLKHKNRAETYDDMKKEKKQAEKKEQFDGAKINRVEKQNSNLFFSYNASLGPPYRIIVDTNFFHFAIENKIDLHQGFLDCLLAKCIPIVTDCVVAELEQLGPKYRLALKIAKDPRNERWPCTHKGTYADDCICHRVQTNRCFIVATMDNDLKRKIRKIPGVPIMYITNHRFSIERFADVSDAPKF